MLEGPDLLVVLAIALIIFGGNKIADLGTGLGKGIRSFKKGLEGDEPPKKKLEDNSCKSQE